MMSRGSTGLAVLELQQKSRIELIKPSSTDMTKEELTMKHLMTPKIPRRYNVHCQFEANAVADGVKYQLARISHQ